MNSGLKGSQAFSNLVLSFVLSTHQVTVAVGDLERLFVLCVTLISVFSCRTALLLSFIIMYPASLILQGKAKLSGSDAQIKLSELLLDEVIQVISSFELNQIASLTYGDMVCDEIFEMIEDVIAHPMDHSPLALQKSLVVTKHVVIYGSEKTINSAWALGKYVNDLRQFNTVLIAQQRQGPDAFWQRIKGGGVDRGFPVREAAEALHTLLQSREQLQMTRHSKADPNSLVPVGDDKIAFASDEVRHYLLKKRLQEQQMMHTKSNLTKERGGFGGGYQAKDGKQVVGAAHSLEEMIARANQEKQKFSDDGPVRSQHFLSYEHPAPVTAAPEVDLLDFSSPDPVISSAPASTDLLGTADLLGATESSTAAETSSSLDATADLLSLMTVAAPTAPTSAESNPMSAVHDSFAPVAPAPAIMPQPESGTGMKPPAMNTSEDRFAALDALALNGMQSSGSILTGVEAQNRILGSFNLNETSEVKKQSMNGMGGSGMETSKSQPFPSLGGASMAMTTGLSSLSTVPPVEEYVEPNFSGIAMGATYGDPAVDDDDENGFVMGGVAGSGLEPVAPPPAGAPPPPPPMY